LADVAPVARAMSGPLSQVLKEKVLSEVQISDLGPHNNFFVTASSAIIPELGEVIGVAGDFITARIDFRKEGIVEKIDITSEFTGEDLEQLKNILPAKPSGSIFSVEEVSIHTTNALLKKLHTQKANLSAFDVLNYIANHSQNPAKDISIWLTAKAYIDLVNIPKRAINYLDEATAEDMALPFTPTGYT